MPNNTAIMLSFAACFALKLSTQISGGNSSSSMLAPSVRTLIDETADLLEKTGGITKHRNGMGRLYGKYLRLLMRKAARATDTTGPSRLGQGTPRAAAAYSEYARQTSGLAFSRPTAAAAATDLRSAAATSSSNANVDSAGFAIPPAYGTYEAAQGWTTANPSDIYQFSAMSDDQIVEALNRAGDDFDSGELGGGLGGDNGGGEGVFSWEDATNPNWMNWNNMPDFGFS